MTFKDELVANDYRRPLSVPCTVGAWRSKQTPVDQREFDEALATDIKSTVIYRTMRGRGFGHDVGTLQRHRRKDCLCDIQG